MKHWIGLIVGGVWLLAAVVLFVIAMVGLRASPQGMAHGVGTSGSVDTSAIEPFLVFARESAGPDRDDLPPMGLHHQYAAEGLRRLAQALSALRADRNAVATLQNDADRITQNPRSLSHADLVHEAFSAAAHELGRTTPADAAELRKRANAIHPGRRLLDQKPQVEAFFEAAGRAVAAAHVGTRSASGQGTTSRARW